MLLISPDHAGARARLGYTRVGDHWMNPDETLAACGMVRSGGEWVSKGAARRLADLEDRVRQLEADLAASRRATREAPAAQPSLSAEDSADRRLERLEEKVDRIDQAPPTTYGFIWPQRPVYRQPTIDRGRHTPSPPVSNVPIYGPIYEGMSR